MFAEVLFVFIYFLKIFNIKNINEIFTTGYRTTIDCESTAVTNYTVVINDAFYGVRSNPASACEYS